jgi:hypothetical protein
MIGHVLVGSAIKPVVACSCEISLSTIKKVNVAFPQWDNVVVEYEKTNWAAQETLKDKVVWAMQPDATRKAAIIKELTQAITDWEQKHGRVLDEDEKKELMDNWGMCSRGTDEAAATSAKRKATKEDPSPVKKESKKSPRKPRDEDVANLDGSRELATSIEGNIVSKIHEFTAANYVQQLAEMRTLLDSQSLAINRLEQENKNLLVECATLRAKLEAAHMIAEERLKMANEIRDFYRANKQ